MATRSFLQRWHGLSAVTPPRPSSTFLSISPRSACSSSRMATFAICGQSPLAATTCKLQTDPILRSGWSETGSLPRIMNSPMPFSIFFYHGYAIHGSYAIDRLGGPASHGCVRLHPHHAAILFDLVQREGPERTTIEITDQGRPDERSALGREMPPPGGMNPPVPKLARYPEGSEMPDLPPPPRGNRPVMVKNGPPPPRPALVASRVVPDVGPRASIGATEADTANGAPRAPKEPPSARSKPTDPSKHRK